MKFNESEAMELNYPKCFIYFLIKDNEVVYVGQTKWGPQRPLSHKDKPYDIIKIICCKENELDLLEDKYIAKYLPIHNKMLNTSINYSLSRARKKIRKYFNTNQFTVPELKKIVKKLNIELCIFNGNQYLKQNDLEKIINYCQNANCVGN